MAVLIHQRPDGELVVSECDWLDGVQSFDRILTTYYGDSPKSVWDTSNQEERGLRSALDADGDIFDVGSCQRRRRTETWTTAAHPQTIHA